MSLWLFGPSDSRNRWPRLMPDTCVSRLRCSPRTFSIMWCISNYHTVVNLYKKEKSESYRSEEVLVHFSIVEQISACHLLSVEQSKRQERTMAALSHRLVNQKATPIHRALSFGAAVLFLSSLTGVQGTCLSNATLEAIFAGGDDVSLPRDGSCCMQDICGLTCPTDVSKPGPGESSIRCLPKSLVCVYVRVLGRKRLSLQRKS